LGFPSTRYSVVLGAASPDPETRQRAFSSLVETYWKPVYKYVRLKWQAPREEAEDLTQGFFTRAFEKDFFQPYDPAKARFRTFLRTCLDGFIANERKAASRLKRGGAVQLVALDFETAEGELRQHDIAVPPDMDEYFEREWARSVLALSVDRLRARCAETGRVKHFQAFERYDLDAAASGQRVTYSEIAKDLGVSATDVTNYLAAARREFRAIVLERLRELTTTDEEFRDEARRLLGVEL
jgi:RNA polymerase sigma factor (sigma-70 family)